MTTFEVEVVVRKTIRFPEVRALSPESAEAIVESILREAPNDIDPNFISSIEIEQTTATPVEDFIEPDYEIEELDEAA